MEKLNITEEISKFVDFVNKGIGMEEPAAPKPLNISHSWRLEDIIPAAARFEKDLREYKEAKPLYEDAKKKYLIVGEAKYKELLKIIVNSICEDLKFSDDVWQVIFKHGSSVKNGEIGIFRNLRHKDKDDLYSELMAFKRELFKWAKERLSKGVREFEIKNLENLKQNTKHNFTIQNQKYTVTNTNRMLFVWAMNEFGSITKYIGHFDNATTLWDTLSKE